MVVVIEGAWFGNALDDMVPGVGVSVGHDIVLDSIALSRASSAAVKSPLQDNTESHCIHLYTVLRALDYSQ
ncbi:hypothetical protein BVU17_15485 [Haloarcula taiwanensis]|uniref:Uncharacterized protein n=1 Tax=Haloarcula taiwanensis TaxID=1932004 RepID=A0A2H5A2M8_9EURY|nr:hypothetical protein BVU17_15485 [Haloarcula taiwanensis]RLM34789.1 hypothetical protein DVK01_14045 [Haloarcula sp. Atlit-120R]RLM44203.1 hypothetical protein DVK00_14240 [Haloarcula sp. Atlit-47R]